MDQAGAAGNDVFVSYAHADNRVPVGLDAGWVTTLTRNLIAHSSTAKCRFYTDHQLEPGDHFSEDLMRQVERCRMLLIVLSQNYVASEWCGREVQHFLQMRNGSGPMNVMVVEISPFSELVNVPEHIRKLRTLIQSKFWHRQPEEKRFTQLGYPAPPMNEAGKEGYWSRISDLAQAISEKLAAQEVAPHVPEPKMTVSRTRTIVLADVTDDLESDRIAVKAGLEREGITVLPERDYGGLSFSDFMEAFQNDLARSEMFVQLLSKTAGRLQSGFPDRIPRLQFDLAKDTSREIIQWCDTQIPDTDCIQDPKHAALFSSEYIRAVNLESFKDEIKDRLALIERRRLALEAFATEQKKADDEAKMDSAARPAETSAHRLAAHTVFVDDEFSDEALAHRIRAIIKSEHCIIRSWPKTVPLRPERGIDRAMLRICKGGLTLYVDKRDQTIVHYRLLHFLNLVAEDQLPLSKWCVYFGPPKDTKHSVPIDFGIDSDDVIGIMGMHQFNEADLRAFLRSVRGDKQ